MKHHRRAITRGLAVGIAALVVVSIPPQLQRAANAAPPERSAYVVAEVPLSTAGGSSVSVSALQIVFCIDNDFANCSTHPLESLTFASITAADAGQTIWSDPTTIGFANVVANLTDGELDHIGYVVSPDVSGPGWFIAGEPQLLGAQVGPTGVDLSGYAIERIGFRVDSVSIASPGSDPNGDGNWTDFTVDGAFVFEGTIASPAACRHGGWQSLRGPGGAAFLSQGDCARFAATGR